MIRLSAPPHNIKGSVRLSGSKSISNRLLILSEVLGWQPEFENLSDSRDTVLLQRALQQIRATASQHTLIDIQDAGTDMRFLTALLSVTEGEWTITGSGRMKQRPVGELADALIQLGAEIGYTEKEGFPPLKINGKPLAGGTVEINTSVSSQFVSALLLIAPSFKNGLNLVLKGKMVSRPYINMTVELLKEAGISIAESSQAIQVSPSAPYKRRDRIYVESDWSSASYWYAICALAGNADIELAYLDKTSRQADAVLPELFKNLGVNTVFKDNTVLLTSVKPALTEFRHDFTDCPDIAQTLATTCFGLGIKAELSGLSTLKVKETDRIRALKTELEKLGAKVTAGEDTLTIYPAGTRSQEPGTINTYDDHRMAMSFAALALRYSSIRIDDAGVVRKSYPAFWDDLKSLGFNVNLQA